MLAWEAISAEVVRQLDLAKEQAACTTGPLPVVFTPNGVASAFVRPLMAAFNGKTVLEGASPVGGRLGEKVFDERLSLRDDPTIAYRPGSSPCDDEAVPSEPTALISDGKVRGFLYDLQTAALAGARSTGNGRRSPGGLPAPAPSSFVIAPGEASFEDMVGDIKEGLVVEQLMGATQGNVLGGDFSGNVLLGFKVENGRIVGRVKDTMVSGNIYQLLKNVGAIGSEVKWVAGFLSTPSVYCPNVSVASK
jgi:PmbA protein